MSGPVILTMAPNAPMAEVLCAQLRDEGIPAYYGSAGNFVLWGQLSTTLNPSMPVDVYVRPEDLERAKTLVEDGALPDRSTN